MTGIDPNTALLLGIAALNALTAFLAWRGKNAAIETRAIALKTEVNTNSLMDARIAIEQKASKAEGVKEEKERHK